jgi:hypothetical protein
LPETIGQPIFAHRLKLGLTSGVWRVTKSNGSCIMTDKLSAAERASLQAELEHLRQEHRDLDAAIDALLHLGAADQLQVQRLKKRKLMLRDRLSFIEDQLTPDIIA